MTTSNPHLVLQYDQLWVLIIGAAVPLLTYVLNSRLLMFVPEPVKAAIHVVVSAVAGVLYSAIGTSTFGFNGATLQLVITTIVGTLLAHNWLWKPSGINTALGRKGLVGEAPQVTPVVK